MYHTNPVVKNQEFWEAEAKNLSDFAKQRFLVRRDVYGLYEPTAKTVHEFLSDGQLIKHFSLKQSIGAHCVTPAEHTCKWSAFDLDNHGGDYDHEANAVRILDQAKVCGWPCLVELSNGDGGYHLWFFWEKPLPAATARSLMFWLIKDIKLDYDARPEIYPKQMVLTADAPYGNYLRLPGRHPKRDWVSVFLDGCGRYDGNFAVQYLLRFPTVKLEDIPEEAKNFMIEEPILRNPGPVERTDVPLSDKQRQAKRFLEACPPRREGDGNDKRTFTLFGEVMHDFDLTPEEAFEPCLEWGERPDQVDVFGNHKPWSHREIANKLKYAEDWQDWQERPRGWRLRQNSSELFEEIQKLYEQKSEVRIEEVGNELQQPPEQSVPLRKPVAVSARVVLSAPSDRTAYLWQHRHANPHNVTDAGRRNRQKSVLETFALVPPTGFLPAFLSTYLPTTDTSCQLLLGAALSALASALGRSVWVKNGGRRLYPYLWVALIAASGERKSTAVNLVKNLMLKHDWLVKRYSGGDTTWAAMAAHLGIEVEKQDHEWDWQKAKKYCQLQGDRWHKGVCTLALDEIGGWLKKLDMSYNAGLKETLTGAYESPDFLQKETAEKAYYIHRPCINLVGASTPAWLASNTTEKDVQGGFLGRFTFFVSKGKDYVLPMCDDEDQTAAAQLDEAIEKLKWCQGEYELTPDAWNAYCRWVRPFTCDDRLTAWGTRVGNMVLKLALLFGVSERYEGDIVEGDVLRACRLMDLLMKDLDQFVGEELPMSKEEKDVLRLQKIILKHGPDAPHQTCLKHFKHGKGRFDQALTTLVEQGAVQIKSTSTRTKAGRFYTVEQDR